MGKETPGLLCAFLISPLSPIQEHHPVDLLSHLHHCLKWNKTSFWALLPSSNHSFHHQRMFYVLFTVFLILLGLQLLKSGFYFGGCSRANHSLSLGIHLSWSVIRVGHDESPHSFWKSEFGAFPSHDTEDFQTLWLLPLSPLYFSPHYPGINAWYYWDSMLSASLITLVPMVIIYRTTSLSIYVCCDPTVFTWFLPFNFKSLIILKVFVVWESNVFFSFKGIIVKTHFID